MIRLLITFVSFTIVKKSSIINPLTFRTRYLQLYKYHKKVSHKIISKYKFRISSSSTYKTKCLISTLNSLEREKRLYKKKRKFIFKHNNQGNNKQKFVDIIKFVYAFNDVTD